MIAVHDCFKAKFGRLTERSSRHDCVSTLEVADRLIRRVTRREAHTLPDGVKLELLHHPAETSSIDGVHNPPLLFIHGSGHAAWCWEVWHAALLLPTHHAAWAHTNSRVHVTWWMLATEHPTLVADQTRDD